MKNLISFLFMVLVATVLAGCPHQPIRVLCDATKPCPDTQNCVFETGAFVGGCEDKCTTDANCTDPAAPSCDLTTGLCVADDSCQTTGCDDGFRCVAGGCVPGCFNSDDCAPDQVCTNSQCFPPTNQDECIVSTDCSDPAEPVCNTAPLVNICVECTASAHCTGGDVCTNNSCVPPTNTECQSSFDCSDPAAPVCNTAPLVNICVECTASAHCTGGDVCTNNSCVPPVNTGCADDNDCDPDNDSFCCTDGVDCPQDECFYFCSTDQSCVDHEEGDTCNEATGQCSTGNTGTGCVANGCQAGFTCNASDGICYENGTGACGDSLDCSSNEVCIDNQCVEVECTTQSECGGGYCWKGECYPFTCNADHMSVGANFLDVEPSYIPGSNESDASIRVVGTGGFLGGDPSNPNIGWDPAQARFLAPVGGKYRLAIPNNDQTTDIIRLTPRNFSVDFDDIDWDRDGSDQDEFSGFWFGDICFQSGLVDEDDDGGYEFTGWNGPGQCFYSNGAAFYPNYLGSGNLTSADYNTASLVIKLLANSGTPDINIGNMETYTVANQNTICP